MYKIPLSDLKEKIVASGKIEMEQLNLKIKNKINELSGLISEEGAAHIIANELNVELINSEQDKLKIKQIYAGMRNVSTVGKIVRKFDVREFSKGDSTGRVCSIIIGDETGTIRVVFWNDQVDLLKNINENDTILIKEAYVKENNNNREIHIGSNGIVEVNPLGEKIDSVREANSFERKKIGELSDGEENVEIMGTIVQAFDPRFFNVCPECNKRIMESEGGFSCNEHGKVEPVQSYVMNAIVDDGSGNIRAVFWKKQTNHLLEKNEEDVLIYKDNLALFEDVKTELLGEQYKLVGRVKKNEMFDRLEFNAQLVNKARPEEEIARLEKVN